MMVNQHSNGWPKLVAFAIIVLIGLSVMATMSTADFPGQVADYNTQRVQDTALAGQIDHDLQVMATLQPYEVEATRQAIVRESTRADALQAHEQARLDQQLAYQKDIQTAEVDEAEAWTETYTYLTRVAGTVVMTVVGGIMTFITCAYALARIRLATPAKAEQPTAPPPMPPVPSGRPTAPSGSPMAPTPPNALANPPRLMPLRERPLREQTAPLTEITLAVSDLTYSPNGHSNGHGLNGHGPKGGYSKNGGGH